ncbi:MAG: DNA polymerase III subunit delta' [Bdellovibrionaceae bacterium]|nr:DNA polymerase III subunit delta' [Pseudobdellovibrionaceae bacterium]
MARLLDQVFGHKDLISKMLQAFSGERPGQTFLFVGPSGIGKKKIAIGFAQALLCEKTRTACGSCPGCLRVAAGAHESLKIVLPTGSQIKIDDSRDIIEFLSLQSLTPRRVVIIDQAQLLNLQAANSLLKTLEEPPAETYFFLLAPSAAGLLPTLRSRSRTVGFKPLKSEEIRRGATEAPEWAVRACQGSFEKLAQLLDVSEIEIRGQAFLVLQQFFEDKEFLTENTWRDIFKERQRSQRIFSYWISFLRDVLYYQEGQKKSILNVDQGDLLKMISEQKRSRLLDFLEKIMRVELEVGQNRDVQLMIEELWVHEQDRGKEI